MTGTSEYLAISWCGTLVSTHAWGARRRAYLDLRVVANARKYALRHTADDTCGVTDALIHAELDILLAQEEGAPTKKIRGSLCADPCARAAFGKEEGDGLVLQRFRTP